MTSTGHAGAYSDAVVADDPINYWRLGEANATDTAADLGLLGIGGAYTPGVTLGAPGLVAGETDSSLRLAASGERMETPGFDKFSDVLGFGGTGFSVEFWAAFGNPTGGFANLVGDGESGGDFNLMVYARGDNGIRPHVQTDAGVSAIDSVRAIGHGEIVHVVSTWDSTSGDLQLYLDGALADSTSIAAPLPNSGTPVNIDNPIFIGQDGREGRNADIWLDEVALYNYPLDPARVMAHYDVGRGAPSPVPPPPMPYPDPGNLADLPDGLISFIDFDEGSGPNETGGLNFAYDRQGANDGSFEGNATREAGIVGVGAARFDNTGGTQVNLGPGVDNGFSTTTGITIEALILPEWTGDGGDYDEIFRKEDGGNRILFSFQNDGFNGGANPPVEPGPVLSFGLNVNGTYGELDMPLDGQEGRPTVDDLKDGIPHHAVATYDSATGEKAIWIDGQKLFSVDEGAGSLIASGGGANAYIGNVNGGEPFLGVIDEVAIWNRALSAEEIGLHLSNVASGGNYFVPEPGAMSLILMGLLGLAAPFRRPSMPTSS
jgi:hypothetical protein